MGRRSSPSFSAVLHSIAAATMFFHLRISSSSIGSSSLSTLASVPLFVSSFSLNTNTNANTNILPQQHYQHQRQHTKTSSQLFSSSPPPSKNPKTQTASYLEKSLSGYKPPSVNWYPGHIAKAERTLSETLSSADVLLEIRDARIPKATAHPRVREWTVGKPRIVVFTRVDMVPKASVREWEKSLLEYGAGRWDGSIEDGNLRHAARQNMRTRGLDVDVRKKGNMNNSNSKNNTNNSSNRPAHADEGGLVEDVIYVDAKRGSGIPALLRSIGRAGGYVNEKRSKRGLRERPLRVAVLGYPNVGKSALINRILGRKRAKSANTPGITRSLQWIRVRGDLDGTDVNGRSRKSKSKAHASSKMTTRAGDFELLDSPGIIPANMENQEDAILLAICNSIGTGAYDNQGVAAYLCERLKTLCEMEVQRTTAPVWRGKSVERYGFDPLKPMAVPTLDTDQSENMRIPTGEDMLFQVAENTCRGDPENAARKILQDFRNGRMGPICLQLAPEIEEEDDSTSSIDADDVDCGGERFVAVRREIATLGEKITLVQGGIDGRNYDSDEERRARAEIAMKAAKERGLELPPLVEDQIQIQDGSKNNNVQDSGDNGPQESEVGKGLFDGW